MTGRISSPLTLNVIFLGERGGGEGEGEEEEYITLMELPNDFLHCFVCLGKGVHCKKDSER